MAKGGRFAKGRKEKVEKKKSGNVGKVLAIVAIAILLMSAAFLGGMVYQKSLARFEAVKPTVPALQAETVATQATEASAAETAETTEATTVATEPPYTPSGKDIINVMVIGQSFREDEQNYLSDTNILVTVNLVTKTMTLTSFLRDTYIDLPNYDFNGVKKNCGYNKINTAYANGYSWGGVDGAMYMMKETIKLNFGVDVDYCVEVNFEGFIDAMAVLGMIPMELSEDEAAYLNKYLNKALGRDAYHYAAVYEDGRTVTYMDPMTCLYYARMRHANAGDSDFNRTERQRKLIGAIIEQIRGRSFTTLMRFAKEILETVETDMSNGEILTCMWEILPLLKDLKIEQNSVPMDGTYGQKILHDANGNETYAMDITWNTENRDYIMSYAEADTLATANN